MIKDRESASTSIRELSDADLVEVIESELARRDALHLVSDDVAALLAMAPELARWRKQAAGNPARDAAARNRIANAAIRSIVDTHPMLGSAEVARALGHASGSRNSASRLARSGKVIALPIGARHVFPAFQFDSARREVLPIVAEINTLLDAAADPWGVASWWLSETAWSEDNRSPADLAEAGGFDDTLRDMAADVLED